MTDEQLKQAVQFNRRPDRYMKGDRVIVRAPEGDENHDSWQTYARYLGKTGVVRESIKNQHDNTTRIELDEGGTTPMRAHWIELY